ncbi:5'-nucleotidase C-terminal domain-containing protein [Cognatishimia sp.]|uniref:5'-nucleotidase C-terminal domain-containing protein n=1 Tax=Cognatishimia sp. TaxID=2211648 RepID=UPI003515794C|nr:5'-nucleotidase C-terminal domain-containing protein [Cognatishimia sp.]
MTPPSPDPILDLRILATSDMHGHIGGCSETTGWAFVSNTLASLTAESENHFLFDNGDFLQGTPICDLMAFGALGPAQNHPAIGVMNGLGYDAVGLGNHEFDYGLKFLREALSKATFPVLCSNLETQQDAWERDLILKKNVVDSSGEAHPLSIGVFSLVPPQVMDWCRVHLEDKAQAFEFQETAIERITSLKSRGADLVFALCHAGDVATNSGGSKSPLASEITSIPGLDLVICGHTHHLSPKQGERNLLFRAPRHSDSGAVPMVLPSDRGRHVGCIDLKLQKTEHGWIWVQADCRNIDVSEEADPSILELAAPWIARAQQAVATPIGHSEIAISTHFSAIQCDPATRLAAAAKLRAAKPLLHELGYKDLPIVAAASPFRAGHDGPTCYTSVPAGPTTRRQLYDIYPYFNAIDAFEVTGAQILDWLEASVSVFFQMVPGQPDQPLWNRQFPTYEFDSLLGLTYDIDLSKPAAYTPDRRPSAQATGNRIGNLRLDGAILDPETRLILVSNAYRGGGGGGFPHLSSRNRISLPFRDVRVSVQELLEQGLAEHDLPPPSWQFTALPETSATFETGSDAANFIPDALANRLTDLGETPQGFRKYRLSLDR